MLPTPGTIGATPRADDLSFTGAFDAPSLLASESVEIDAVGNLAAAVRARLSAQPGIVAGVSNLQATAWVRAAAIAQIPGTGGHFNFVRNPLNVGAVPGTPGTLPTFWTIALSAGISSQVVALGTDPVTGLAYIDIRLFGTTSTGSSNIRMDAQFGAIPATNGETWTQSVYVAQVGGSMTDVTGVGLQLYQNSNAGIVGNTGAVSVMPPVGALGRISRIGTIATAGTLWNWPVINIYHNASRAIDVTLRLAGPQLELGSTLTGIMLPPAGTTARSSFGILNDVDIWMAAATALPGTGAVLADGIRQVPAAATIAGVGTVQADGLGRDLAAAMLAGTGSVTGAAVATRPAAARTRRHRRGQRRRRASARRDRTDPRRRLGRSQRGACARDQCRAPRRRWHHQLDPQPTRGGRGRRNAGHSSGRLDKHHRRGADAKYRWHRCRRWHPLYRHPDQRVGAGRQCCARTLPGLVGLPARDTRQRWAGMDVVLLCPTDRRLNRRADDVADQLGIGRQ